VTYRWRLSALALTFAAGVAAAQPAAKPSAAPTQAAPAAPAATPAQEPPYEPDLLRLAEIMGALAYLRDLCGDDDGAEWRNRVAALIAAESNDPARKEELAGAFNRGFRGYGLTYHSCTPAAHVVIDRFLAEGGRLARDITSRYGGG
jgi:uncharacterized protein (TIGR02301 family)